MPILVRRNAIKTDKLTLLSDKMTFLVGKIAFQVRQIDRALKNLSTTFEISELGSNLKYSWLFQKLQNY
jgi:hypothetical protein